MKYGIFPLPQTAKIWTYSAFALSVFSVRITDLWIFYEVFPSNKLLAALSGGLFNTGANISNGKKQFIR